MENNNMSVLRRETVEDFLVIPDNIWNFDMENCTPMDVAEEERVIESIVHEDASDISNDTNNTECCICFEIINKSKNNCTTECGHSFCLKCLATSMYHNNSSCPYCRTPLIDEMEEEEDEEDEDEYYEEDDEDDDEGTEVDDEEFQTNCNVEEITRRLQANGLSMTDIVSMFIGRYSRDEKYTEEYIMDMETKFDTIIYEADKETYEQKMFAAEDSRNPPSPTPTLLSL
jgi:Ring finger domain